MGNKTSVRATANSVANEEISAGATAIDDLPDYRLFLSNNTTVAIGGAGTIFGTNDGNIVYILDEPGTVIFDPSFNRGKPLSPHR